MYKKGLSKTKFKNKMRMFWTKYWKYERTVDQWVNSLTGPQVEWSGPTGIKHVPLPNYKEAPFHKKAKDLLEDALDKLVLEKKLKKEEAQNLKKMLEGTSEDAFVAISIMASLKPKKFKRVLKNTDLESPDQ